MKSQNNRDYMKDNNYVCLTIGLMQALSPSTKELCGRVVASDTSDMQFEYHQFNITWNIFVVLKKRKSRAGMVR